MIIELLILADISIVKPDCEDGKCKCPEGYAMTYDLGYQACEKSFVAPAMPFRPWGS